MEIPVPFSTTIDVLVDNRFDGEGAVTAGVFPLKIHHLNCFLYRNCGKLCGGKVPELRLMVVFGSCSCSWTKSGKD
jgi:hypothetical protein